MQQALAVYLRNHDAAAGAGHQLFVRVARSQRGRAHGDRVAGLADRVGEDVATLRTLMAELGVRRAPLMVGMMRAGEWAGRLKPNGSLVRRTPLTDLIEVEGLLDAVHAKAAGWGALRAAGPYEDVGLDIDERLAGLAERAEDQLSELRQIHTAVADAVLRDPRRR